MVAGVPSARRGQLGRGAAAALQITPDDKAANSTFHGADISVRSVSEITAGYGGRHMGFRG